MVPASEASVASQQIPMNTSQNIYSLLPRMSGNTFNEQLPWKTALLSSFLAFVGCQKLSALGPSSMEGNLGLSFFLVACAATVVSLFPGEAFRAFLCLYL